MTQKDKVIERIKEVGFVDNFWAFHNKVSLRLGAIIFEMKKEGWDFDGQYKITDGSDKNYHYYPIKWPADMDVPMRKWVHVQSKSNPEQSHKVEQDMFGNRTCTCEGFAIRKTCSHIAQL